MKNIMKLPVILATLLLVNGACASRPLYYSVGEPEVSVKETAWIDTEPGEWDSIKPKYCITHLYQSEFNDKGEVTGIQPLDLSNPAFQGLTEEAVKAWKFKPGKAGQNFVDFVYTHDGKTRIILLNQDHAKKVASARAKEREESAQRPKKAKAIKQAKPEFPMGELLRGTMGMVHAQLDVNPEGVPENIRIVKSVPDMRSFEVATRSALGRWRYKPLAEEPDAIRSNIDVIFYYNIEGALGYDCDLQY